ncbi:hypothetical protein LCGC14_1515130 [marine sediment metagenome]|uniref:Uncharacterized protein n=1 Tax=marine sediment metagenome TaxID=412755 RepID=A0A0F9J0E0_9ZZZZ
MIYTRYESREIKILKAFPKRKVVQVKRVYDNKIFECLYSQLRADGGVSEIEKEIRIATPTNMSGFGALI